MPTKSTKRREWTSDNVRTLKMLARKKTRCHEIAKTLKRTEGATRQKAFSLGLSLDSACIILTRSVAQKALPRRGFLFGNEHQGERRVPRHLVFTVP